jgi:hypothetical protein
LPLRILAEMFMARMGEPETGCARDIDVNPSARQ